jgi:hypothetical protein
MNELVMLKKDPFKYDKTVHDIETDDDDITEKPANGNISKCLGYI